MKRGLLILPLLLTLVSTAQATDPAQRPRGTSTWATNYTSTDPDVPPLPLQAPVLLPAPISATLAPATTPSQVDTLPTALTSPVPTAADLGKQALPAAAPVPTVAAPVFYQTDCAPSFAQPVKHEEHAGFWGRLCTWATYRPHCACSCGIGCTAYNPYPVLATYFYCPNRCVECALPGGCPVCGKKGCTTCGQKYGCANGNCGGVRSAQVPGARFPALNLSTDK